MVDKITVSRRSQNMRAIRSKDMKPELKVRSCAHHLGFRFRLHSKDLPGKPDMVFRSRKKVIFVHGCFWHQHEDPNCVDGRMPKSRVEYWSKKFEKNKIRDAKNILELKEMGWKVLIVWECETTDLAKLKELLTEFLLEGDS